MCARLDKRHSCVCRSLVRHNRALTRSIDATKCLPGRPRESVLAMQSHRICSMFVHSMFTDATAWYADRLRLANRLGGKKDASHGPSACACAHIGVPTSTQECIRMKPTALPSVPCDGETRQRFVPTPGARQMVNRPIEIAPHRNQCMP